ncbi:MAG: DNA-directed RNA polymerase [Watsoniomyces obsoletus]|nr:MAG: DNA-directed RNA polymerase [Watsoniomyces obsoletus]
MGTTWCMACRMRWLKRIGSFPVPPAFSSHVNRLGSRFEYVRPFGAASSRKSDRVQDVGEKDELEASAKSEADTIKKTTGLAVAEESLPWYLRTDSPLDGTPKAPEPALPDLPEHPPPLLQPLMQHVSLDLGLDDLSLLDCRTLDPPPALGANVIMMVGTARSEKHLHVSADRLCRWLRTEYGLNPYADGLLGRNEIKLKRRRNVRRARLLGTSGRAGVATLDDGIRTAWVCVNVGRVEPAESQRGQIGPREGITGFGSEQESVNLVVQMFTGEKRAELDLEGLWQSKLERHRKELSSQEEQSPVQLPSEVHRSMIAPMTPLQSLKHDSIQSAAGPRVHVRGFHTGVRRPGVEALEEPVGETTAKKVGETYQARTTKKRAQMLKQIRMGRASPPSMNPRRGASMLEPRSRQPLRGEVRAVPPDRHSERLPPLVEQLKSCSTNEMIRLLGKGSDDYTSTSFLRGFYQAFPLSPTYQDWDCRVMLTVLAIHGGHPGYKKAALGDLLRSMQLSGVTIQEHTLLKMFNTVLLREPYSLDEADNYRGNYVYGLLEADLRLALTILEDMEHRGYPVATQEILVDLVKATSSSKRMTGRAAGLPADVVWSSPNPQPVDRQLMQRMEEQQGRLHFLMKYLPLPIDSEEELVRLLKVYGKQGTWDRFWDVWALLPQRMRRRTSTMYGLLFEQVAKTRHQAECIRVLRAWLPQMVMEKPSVTISSFLARRIQRCILCAHPSVVEEAKIVPPVVGEWIRWWRICEQVRAQAKEADDAATPKPSEAGSSKDQMTKAASPVDRQDHSQGISAI